MQYKGIIFDLDDTIWDFHANSQVALRGVWQEIHRIGIEKLNIKQFDNFLQKYNIINKRLWKEYRDGLRSSDQINKDRFTLTASELGVQLNEKQQEDIANLFLSLLYQGQILMPHALDTLDYLNKKYDLGLITNGFAEGLKRLKSCDLERFFKTVVCSEIYGKPKPDKGIFLHAIEELGGKPNEYLYVGDNYDGDVIGAKNAGLDAVYLNLHDFDYSDCLTKPNYVIKSLNELKNFL